MIFAPVLNEQMIFAPVLNSKVLDKLKYYI
jgi:hypothetical protein